MPFLEITYMRMFMCSLIIYMGFWNARVLSKNQDILNEIYDCDIDCDHCSTSSSIYETFKWLIAHQREVSVENLVAASIESMSMFSNILSFIHRVHRSTPALSKVHQRVSYVPDEIPYEDVQPIKTKGTKSSPTRAHIFIADSKETLQLYFKKSRIMMPKNVSDITNIVNFAILQRIKEYPVVHSMSKVLVILLEKSMRNNCRVTMDTYRSILHDIWNYQGVVNCILVIKSLHCPDSIFEYDPFGYYHGYYGLIMRVINTNESILSHKFSRRLNDLRGYQLYLSAYTQLPNAVFYTYNGKKYSSTNVKILDTLQDKMNFHYSLINLKWSNNLCTSTYLNIVFFNCDLSLNICPCNDVIKFGSQVTTGWTRTMPISVIVPTAMELESWKIMYLALSPSVWMYSVLTYICSSIFWCVFSREKLNYHSLCNGFVDMIHVFLGISWCKINRLVYSSQRVLIFFCLYCFSIVMVCLFQSSVFELLTNPPKYPQIDTLEALENSDYVVHYRPSSKVVEMLNFNKYSKRLTGKFVSKNDFETFDELFEYLLKTRRGFAREKPLMDLLAMYMPETFQNFFTLRDSMYYSLSSFHGREDSPYINRMNDILVRIIESGVKLYWDDRGIRNFVKMWRVSKGKSINVTWTESDKTFGMRHLLVPFVVLILSWLSGVGIFMLELLTYYSSLVHNTIIRMKALCQKVIVFLVVKSH